ncbi:adenylate/guanylate cyclase domain-containing protein [uncultured Agrobacterium sp.]|uniref:adenylate/guanylate cyclase domain-containing protein n=1 Tax=uncultured Agrobacterium sp. TaxID=157277 RepID=UPI0025EBA0F3|nr:adenylate/guanylate cyclase domain-containing protein [uncultured Agrobacterium sp.]
MAWNEDRARMRIRRFIDSVPEGRIVVEDFRSFLSETKMAKGITASAALTEASLVDIPRNRAITTHAVHVYANLIDFNSVLVDAGRETEASHRRAFEFLHAHYSACDALIDEFEIQRVDFHGSRLHAVVLAPEGPQKEGARVRKAIAFAAGFREMVERLGQEHTRFQTGVRIGIDSGPAVAIDGGRKDEREPLFIGSPANHAAKLADGKEPGVAVSRRAAAAIDRAPQPFSDILSLSKSLERQFLDEHVVTAGVDRMADARLETAYMKVADELRARESGSVSEAVFRFQRKAPPLKDIVYADHPPSRAIRMEMASLFADIDGFTAYIDDSIRTGRIAEAVSNLHVMRAEMAAVLREDFGGRKVRFVGDCIHGMVAEGDARSTDAMATMRTAVNAAAGLRSSFELCRTMLPGADRLGLAIGIDYGETPVCRLGLRGQASVRAAASRATCVSEAEQRRCDGRETALGEAAFAASPAVVRQVFISGRKVPNFDHDAADLLLGTMQSPYLSSGVEADPMRAHSSEDQLPMRAHDAW